jgi:hypothetical protein
MPSSSQPPSRPDSSPPASGGPGAVQGDCPSGTVGDHASFGAVAATRAPKRLAGIALRWRPPFRAAPAAFWCARMPVPSRKAMSERDAALLRRLQQALPHLEPAPAVEGLRRPPPWAEFGRDWRAKSPRSGATR